MTEQERQSLKRFEAKVRQVIAQFRVLQKENADLYLELEAKEEEVKTLKEQLEQSERDYNNLRLAKVIEVSDSDIKDTKLKIIRMVREINKCINMLTTEDDSEK